MSAAPENILRKFGRKEPRIYGRIKVYTLGDEEPKLNRPYLLKGIIYRGDLIFVTGDPGSGKTTLTQYIALAIAQGRSIFGRRVRKGRVLYLAFEGKDLFLVKMSVFEGRFGSSQNIVYATQSMRLLDNAPFGDDANVLVKIIKDEGVDLLICDTWSKMLANADDKTHEVASGMISVLDRIREETGAAVMVNAHPNRTNKGDVSGSFTVMKDCDALIAVEGTDGVRVVKAVKMRFDEIGPLFSFKLNRVVVSVDDDGDETTSVDLEEVATTTRAAAGDRAARLTKGDQQALKWLREAIDQHGKLDCYDVPRNCRAVTVDEWALIGKKRDRTKTDEARNKQISRAFTNLVAANLAQANGEVIWLLKEKD